jgi:hypothetical protein
MGQFVKHEVDVSFSDRRTSWKGASTGADGFGSAARHGIAYQHCGPRTEEFQHLPPSGRRA